MTAIQPAEILRKRTSFFSRTVSSILLLFGIVAIAVQIVKYFLEGEWTFSLGLASLFGVVLILLGRNKIWKNITNYYVSVNRKRAKLTAFFSPVFLVALTILLWATSDSGSWKQMNTEGGFIEYGTGLAYILAVIFAVPVAKYFIKLDRRLLGYYYYLLSAFSLLICLEELSWGQRFIPIKSPEFFEDYNSKSELSIHNLVWIEQYIYLGFMIIGLLGGISWLFVRLKKWKNSDTLTIVFSVIPDWYLSSYFVVLFLYAFIAKFTGAIGEKITTFVEPIELLLSLGFLGFVIVNYFRQPLRFDRAQSTKEIMHAD